MTMRSLDPNHVDSIVIHITVSNWGNVEAVDRWHRQRGYACIGYHFIILNCFPTSLRWKQKRPDPWSDGAIRSGRQLIYQGAHVRGHNGHTIGIALVGRTGQFTSLQLKSAVSLCTDLQQRFPRISTILGHTELDSRKSCPDLDMDMLRWWVKDGWQEK